MVTGLYMVAAVCAVLGIVGFALVFFFASRRKPPDRSEQLFRLALGQDPTPNPLPLYGAAAMCLIILGIALVLLAVMIGRAH